MVSIDFYLNETTRHAHLILPPTAALEHDHYDLVYHIFAVRNTALYSEPVFDKPEGTVHDWGIFEALGESIAAKMGQKRDSFPRPDQVADLGLRSGPYGLLRKHALGLSLKKLKDNPSGVDLGPLQSSLPQRLVHADKRIHCALSELVAELASMDGEPGPRFCGAAPEVELDKRPAAPAAASVCLFGAPTPGDSQASPFILDFDSSRSLVLGRASNASACRLEDCTD